VRSGARKGLFLEFPLLKRELVGLLRTRRAFWLLVLTVGFSGSLPLLAWPQKSEMGSYASEVPAVLLIFFLTQLTVGLVIIPAFSAGAISGERERETYDMVHSTLLSPFSIIFSKVLASAGYVLLLMAASAPAVCVLYLLGGVAFGSLLRCYAVTFTAIVTAALICLAQSMRSRRTAHAVLRGILLVIFWNGGLLILLWLLAAVLHELTGWPGYQGLEPIGYLSFGLSPYLGIANELLPDDFRFIGPSTPPGFPRLSSTCMMVSGLVGAWYLVGLLRKVGLPDLSMSRRRERRLLRKARGERPIRRCLFARGLLTLGQNGFPLLRNPIFLKEIRSEFFGKVWYRRAVFWVSLLVFAGLAVLNYRQWDDLVTVIFAVTVILLLILMPGVTATSFPREIEQGNLDFLRGTLVPLREVLVGKYLAGIYGCLGIPAAAVLVVLGTRIVKRLDGAIWLANRYSLDFYAHFALIGSLVILFSAALGTFGSVISRRSVGALLVSYLSALVIFLVWPIVAAWLFLDWRWAWQRPSFLETFIHATNPFLAMEGLTDAEKADRLHGFLALYGAATLTLWIASSRLLERFRAQDR
jgi:ABC-type transport system involved in multi-copper enzyme maturation permease subunit